MRQARARLGKINSGVISILMVFISVTEITSGENGCGAGAFAMFRGFVEEE